MDEEERPATHETTVINTGGGGGGGGTIVALLVLVVLAIGAFLFFGGYLRNSGDDLNLNVNVETPKVELPDIKIETPPARQEPAAAPANSTGK